MNAFLTLAFLGLVAFASAEDFYGDSDVVVLTPENWEAIHSQDLPVLVEFYAPWCGHCKNMKPAYIAAAETLKDVAVIAAIDADEFGEVASKYGVEGFPTLKLFRNGEVADDYKGGHKAADIVSFIRSATRETINTADGVEAIEGFLTDQASEFVLVAYFTPENEAAEASFKTAAESLRTSDVTIVRVDEAASKKAGISGAPGLKLFRRFEDSEQDSVEFDFYGAAGFNDDILVDWVKRSQIPIFGSLNAATFDRYGLFEDRPFLWLFLDEDEDAGAKARKVVGSVAPQFDGQMFFAYLKEDVSSEVSATFGLEDFPAVMILDEHTKYKCDIMTPEGIAECAKTFLSGEFVQYLRGEAAPEQPTKNGVTQLVATTFNETVAQGDILVEFYAPWCGHCKALEPIYEELGKTAGALEGLVIAKIDATANDIPDTRFEVEGFPTLYFKAKDSEEVEKFNGARDLESIIEFLQKKSSADFSKLPANNQKAATFVEQAKDAIGNLGKLVEEHAALKAQVAALEAQVRSLGAVPVQAAESTTNEQAEEDASFELDEDEALEAYLKLQQEQQSEEEEEEDEPSPQHDEL